MALARSHVEWLRAQRAAMATEYARARRRGTSGPILLPASSCG